MKKRYAMPPRVLVRRWLDQAHACDYSPTDTVAGTLESCARALEDSLNNPEASAPIGEEDRTTLQHIADEAEAGLFLSPEHQQYALRSILQRAQFALGGPAGSEPAPTCPCPECGAPCYADDDTYRYAAPEGA